jgi:hypothetical protein
LQQQQQQQQQGGAERLQVLFCLLAGCRIAVLLLLQSAAVLLRPFGGC